jgi:hypothetical protein
MPRYAKLKIGQIEGMEQKIMRNESGSLSTVRISITRARIGVEVGPCAWTDLLYWVVLVGL